MKILIVKLSSLGDVVHAMPAVQDILRARPEATIDWVVERGFAPLVQRCEGVRRVIGCELRRWRKAPLSAQTRSEWRAFREELRKDKYDAVIDLQGLTKSALVARAARLQPGGKRFALANQTEGSSYEAPTRWVADVAVPVTPHIHAVERSRELCAAAIGYKKAFSLSFGLGVLIPRGSPAIETGAERNLALVHGTSRADKLWPESHWQELGAKLIGEGFTLALPHGSDEERERSQRLAAKLGPQCEVWPRLELGELTDRLARSAGVIGVDSGLSHIAVALARPHVQIYNFDTAWRTGPLPQGDARQRQVSVFAQPTPSVEQVWRAWREVSAW